MSTTLDLQLASLCAQASAAAYADATIVNADTDTQVLIRPMGGYCVIAFRGTSSRADWLTDLKCRRALYAGDAQVHRGFLAACASVSQSVLDALEDNTLPILITGHSLGGALALLFADWLDRRTVLNLPFRAVYTFGQPRVGDRAFAESYDSRLRDCTFRFVFEEDIVPRVPGVLLGYRHAGQEVFIPSLCRALAPQGYLLNPSLFVKLFSDLCGLGRLWSSRNYLSLLNLIADHPAAGYVRALQAIEPQARNYTYAVR